MSTTRTIANSRLVDWEKLDNAPSDINAELALKVDKITWKWLSTEDYTTAEQSKVAIAEITTNKWVINWYAWLDSAWKVPAAQLPSYVDDVLEFDTLWDFPVTWETGKIYVALDTNKTYRWTGSAYVEIVGSIWVWRGEYVWATSYILDDRVSYLWSSYICISPTTWNLPTNVTYWDVLAEKWDDATADAWTTTTWDAWTNASVTNSWTTSNAVFDFIIPKWDKWEDSVVPWPAAPEVEYEFSIDWITLWHITWVVWDLYQRISTDWGATFWDAIKFVWADGTWSWDFLADGTIPMTGDLDLWNNDLINVGNIPITDAQDYYINNTVEDALVELWETKWTNWVDRTSFTTQWDLAFDEITRVMTVSVLWWETYFQFWAWWKKFTKTTTQSVTIPDVTWSYYTFFDDSWVLQYVLEASIWLAHFTKYALQWLVYWNKTQQYSLSGIWIEQHWVRMSWMTHISKHFTDWAKYSWWSDITWITWWSSTTFTNIESGTIWDEDIKHDVALQTTMPYIYRLWTLWEWTKVTPDNTLAHIVSWDTYASWNEFTGSTWQLTEWTPSTDFLITFVAMTPQGYIKIIAQNAYSTRNNARDAIESELRNLNADWLPSPEFTFLYAMIVKRNWIVQTLDNWSDYLDFRFIRWVGWNSTASSNSASDIATDITNFNWILSSADTDVQKALETLDELNFPAETTTTMWTLINWADAKTTPVDTDLVPIRDVTGWLLEKVTWANIKATLKTYFDSVTSTLTNKTFDANWTWNSLSNVDVADLANWTDWELITWNAAWVADTVAVWTATHVLTSNWVWVAPTFQAASWWGWASEIFDVRMSWNYSFTTSTAKLVFDTETIDTGSNFNTTTYQYTAPSTWNYVINLNLRYVNNTAWDNIQFYIYKNWSDERNIINSTSSDTEGDVWVSTVIALAVNDTVDIRARNWTGARWIVTSGASGAHFSWYKL